MKKIAAAVIISFVGLVVLIVHNTTAGHLPMAIGRLMVVALFGLYVGFGALIAVYRLIAKLDGD